MFCCRSTRQNWLPVESIRASPLHSALLRFFILSPFCHVLLADTALVTDILSALPLSLSVYSPSPAPLHPGKWLYPVEWLCKDVGTGFKLSPAKGKDARGKIKKEEAEKKDSLEFFSPGAKCPCLMQKDESSPCSICERLGGPNSTRGEILSLLWNSCCCRRIQRHLNLRSLCKCHPPGHSRHDDVSECLMSRSPSAADWRGLPLHMHASPRVPDGGCSEGGRHVA